MEDILNKNSKELREEALKQIENYQSTDNKNFYQVLKEKIIKILNECKEYAPTYFTEEYISKILSNLINEYKGYILKGEIELNEESINNSSFPEWYMNSILDTVEVACCDNIAINLFECWGEGDIDKGKNKFEKAFFCDCKVYSNYYNIHKEYTELCDSMNEQIIKHFKKERDYLSFGINSFYKFGFCIAFFYIAIPYYLLKRFSMKRKGIMTMKETMKSPEMKELFIILTKGDIYK